MRWSGWLTLAAACMIGACATPAPTPPATPLPAPNPPVGGVVLAPDATIAASLPLVPPLSVLARAVAAAGLETEFAAAEPVTLLAPTDDAFGRLAPGTVETLLKPENKASLAKLLRYHMIAGTLSVDDVRQRIAAGGGTAMLDTLAGEPLEATLVNNVVALSDSQGNHSYIETGNVRQANGVIHVVNGIMVPDLN